MPAPVSILQCIRQGLVGGGETHLLSLMTHINRSKFTPHVLSFTDGPMVQALKDIDIPVTIIETTKAFDWKVWSSIRQLMASNQFQLAHAHGTRAASNLLFPCKRQNIPMVYTIHGWSFHPDQNKLTYTLRRLSERWLCRQSAANISVSASNQETGKQELGSGFQSHVINNGIDPERFQPQSSFKNIRAEFGVPDGTVLILFLARFTHHKQPLTLLQAFKIALTKLPNMMLLMVGEGDQRKEGEQLTATLGIEDKVIFSNFRSDVPDVLAAADIYVLPSLWEGLPIGLLEAMAMQKAVIGTDVDGTREVIQHGINGLLAGTVNRSEDLAATIVKLAGDSAMRLKLGTQARESILENYNVQQMTRQTEGLYQTILAD